MSLETSVAAAIKSPAEKLKDIALLVWLSRVFRRHYSADTISETPD